MEEAIKLIKQYKEDLIKLSQSAEIDEFDKQHLESAIITTHHIIEMLKGND